MNFVEQAENFIANEKQFHLGFLPTEQSNPKTRSLEADFKRSARDGIRCLQRPDRDVLEMINRVLISPQYGKLYRTMLETIQNGGRVIFSGCGATGRLSILLEAMWRKCCAEIPAAARYADSVESIMTGGDFALVKAVEFFEDYIAFGRRQVQEADMKKGDTLVAITEGGETSSVLGTLYEALDRGCGAFLLFNNPADILSEHLERSRRAITDSRVTVLDLYCGPMALAGSTRMQATTSEQFVAGSALESVMHTLLGKPLPDYRKNFARLLDALESEENVGALADYADFEAGVYRKGDRLTYLVRSFMVDIFTDTSERTPTFMLPAFRACDDKVSPAPWTMVKNPVLETEAAWREAMNRKPRCLNWSKQDYVDMGAADRIVKPPCISAADMLKLRIGSEDFAERYEKSGDAAVIVLFADSDAEFVRIAKEQAAKFPLQRTIGFNVPQADFNLTIPAEDGLLELIRHMAVKLAFNTVSTGIMTILGRVTGNWMSFVGCTNKKLIDRGTRLLVELGNTDYRTACVALFEAMEALKATPGAASSPVQLALKKLRQN